MIWVEKAPLQEMTAGTVAPGLVGPLAAAIDSALGPVAARRLFSGAGGERYFRTPVNTMVDENVPRTVFRDLLRQEKSAPEILRDAGRRSADLLMEERFPELAREPLRALSPRLAIQFLLIAIERSAWLFKGSGDCFVTLSRQPSIEIMNNPLIVPGCPWHCGYFERLFNTLVAANVRVENTCNDCEKNGTCRFEVRTAS